MIRNTSLPVSAQECADSATIDAEPVISAARAMQAAELVWALEKQPDMRALIALIA